MHSVSNDATPILIKRNRRAHPAISIATHNLNLAIEFAIYTMQLMTFNSLLMFDIVFVFFLFLVGVTCLVYYLPPKHTSTAEQHLRQTYKLLGDCNERLQINLSRSSTTLSAAFEMEKGNGGSFTCNSQSKRLAMHHECDSDMEPLNNRMVADKTRTVRFDGLSGNVGARVQLIDEKPTKDYVTPSNSDQTSAIVSVSSVAENPPAYDVINAKQLEIKNTAGPISNV